MGGYGSGRHQTRPITDEACCLDMAAIARHGYLRPGQVSRALWQWLQGGQTALIVILDIDLTASPGWVSFRQRRDGEWHELQPRVPVVFTPQHFGGQRAWWLCRRCGRRARSLYLPYGARLFACRRCYRLTYRSSNESDKRVSAMASSIDTLAAAYHSDHWPTARLWLRAHRLLQRRELHGLPPGRRRRLAQWYGLK